jgi:hypothetical protein
MRVLTFVLMAFGMFLASAGLWAWLPFVPDDMRLDLVGAIFFVVVGTLIYLAASWLDKKLPPEKLQQQFILERNEVGFISGMINRESRRYLAFGLFLLAFEAVIILAVASGGDEPPPAHPIIVKAIFIGMLLFFTALASLSLHRSFKSRNATGTPLYNLLAKTPHLVTGLVIYFIQKDHAPGKMGRQILAELSSGNKKITIGVSEKQFSLLKQYIQLKSPRASYREEEQRV